MRIAFVIDTIEPFYLGGYEKRAFELARRLARGHDVTVLTSSPGERVIDGMRYVPVRPQVRTFGRNGYRSTNEALRFAAGVMWQSVKPHRFDIVDCNATPFLHIPSAHLLARHSGAKLVLSVHEGLLDQLDSYVDERGWYLRRTVSHVLRYGYRKVHSLPDCIVACSDRTAQELEREGMTPYGVTHGGVAWLGQPRSQYSGRIVCVARLVPPKRVSVVIRAFGLAHARGYARSLTIIGDGPALSELEQLTSDLGLAKNVHINPKISESAKREILLTQADLCVSASLREGLSIGTLECLGAGLPVVMSSRPDLSVNGALDYVVDDQNGVVTDGEVETLAEGIGRASQDSSIYARLSNGAFETAKRYTWDQAALELESVYSRLLETDGEAPIVRVSADRDEPSAGAGEGRISVILPVKNDAARARRAILSIRRFAPPDTEIVLVDNESDDDLFGEVAPLADAYVSTAGKLSDCRRSGVAAATGELLLFLDADQELQPGTIGSAVARLCDCDAVIVPERPRRQTLFLHKVMRAERVWTEWLGFGIPRLFRRSSYLSTGGHREGMMFGEDRFANPGRLRVGVSDSPIHHDEISRFDALIRKYRDYGRGSTEREGDLGVALASSLHWPTLDGKAPDFGDLLLLPFALGLKVAKMAIFLEGFAQSRRRRMRDP